MILWNQKQQAEDYGRWEWNELKRRHYLFFLVRFVPWNSWMILSKQ